MADDDVLELEDVVVEGSAEEATDCSRSLTTSRRPLVIAIGVTLVAAILALTTGKPAWLLLALGWWGLRLLLQLVLRRRGLHWMRTVALRPGAVIRVEWRGHDLVVHRPAGTVVFQYAGMEVAGTSERLTMLWVHNRLGSRRRSVLSLPTALVPSEAVARFEDPRALTEDPFGAMELPRVFRVPAGWPRRSYRLSTGRKLALAVLLVIEALLLAVLVTLEAWPLVAVVVAVLAVGLWWARSFAFRLAGRRLPPGAVAGADVADGRVVLALPDQRIDLPESRLRNVIPVGADVIVFLFKGAVGGAIPVPRALLSDEEIDHLRAVAGKRPMSDAQRSPAGTVAGAPA